MYFDSKITKRKGLPWLDARSKWEKSSDVYYHQLEELVQRIDCIEAEAGFTSDLFPADFHNGYQYVLKRIEELRKYIKENDRTELLEELYEVEDDLSDLNGDAVLYDEEYGDDDDDDDFDDDDFDDLNDDFDSDWDDDDDDYLFDEDEDDND